MAVVTMKLEGDFVPASAKDDRKIALPPSVPVHRYDMIHDIWNRRPRPYMHHFLAGVE